MTRALRPGTALAALALLSPLAGVGCRTPAATTLDVPLLERGTRFAPIVPDALDHAAAHLADAVLARDAADAEDALRGVERAEARVRAGSAGDDPAPATGVVPAALDAADAVLHPGRSWRDATEELLERDDLDPALRERLVRELKDDPLELARARLWDARVVDFADVFNAVAEPVGQSILRTAAAPYLLGRSVTEYALDFVEEEPLSLRRRQVLAHWKQFRDRYPDDPEVRELEPRIEAYQARWNDTRYEQALRRAERALDDGRDRAAVLYARRALRYRKGEDAADVVTRAEARIAKRHAEATRSLGFAPPAGAPPVRPGERERVVALLAPGPVREPGEPDPDDPLAPEIRFVHALARGDAGADADMWRILDDLAEDGPPSMARHAEAARRDPVRNAYGAWREARGRERRRTLAWLLLGPLLQGPGDGVTGAIRYLLDLPLRLQGAALLPVRLIELPWRGPTPGDDATAVYARRYLARRPRGDHAEAVSDWLEAHERAHDNYVGALRVAEGRPDPDDAELDALRERAAQQAFDVAAKEERRDLRARLLLNVAKTFPETRAGREAGERARKEAVEHTPHRIALSRGFLRENPEVAGPQGLGLAPGLLDGDPSNGELHPDGVALVGGRDLEISLLAPSGDEDDEPERRTVRVSDAHLARLVARLEETSFRNALVDPDDALEPDAQRDVVFERARLGLADDVDTRPTAEARYAYRGMRERYGMVRSRESILPFDIVVQGSLADFSLGAFPRWRKPPETPDALLYR